MVLPWSEELLNEYCCSGSEVTYVLIYYMSLADSKLVKHLWANTWNKRGWIIKRVHLVFIQSVHPWQSCSLLISKFIIITFHFFCLSNPFKNGEQDMYVWIPCVALIFHLGLCSTSAVIAMGACVWTKAKKNFLTCWYCFFTFWASL